MYQTLFELHYRHEYFADQQGLALHVELSARTATLAEAVDLLITPGLGQLQVRWNDAAHSRAQLLDSLRDETLMFYLYPQQTPLFYQVTAGFPQIHRYQRQISPSKTVQKTAKTFLLFHYGDGGQPGLRGQCHSLDALAYVGSVAELDQLGQVDLSHAPPRMTADEDVQQLAIQGQRRSSMVVLVPVASLSAHASAPSLSLYFESLAFRYKYYLMAMTADDGLMVQAQQIRCTRGLEQVGTQANVTTFVTEVPIKLQQRPDQQFRLLRLHNGKEETLIDPLPHPPVTNLYTHHSADDTAVQVLEAFIY